MWQRGLERKHSAGENLDSAGIADRAPTGSSDRDVCVSDALSGGRELPRVWAKMIKIPVLPEIYLCVR